MTGASSSVPISIRSRPTLISVSPSSLPLSQSRIVTLRGTDFGSSSNVNWKGETLLPVSSTDTQVVFELPRNSVTGTISVGTSQGVSNSLRITIRPTIDELLPDEQRRDGGPLLIRGTGFSPGATIEVDGIAARITHQDAQNVAIVLPSGARTGVRDVEVANPDRTRDDRSMRITRSMSAGRNSPPLIQIPRGLSGLPPIQNRWYFDFNNTDSIFFANVTGTSGTFDGGFGDPQVTGTYDARPGANWIRIRDGNTLYVGSWSETNDPDSGKIVLFDTATGRQVVMRTNADFEPGGTGPDNDECSDPTQVGAAGLIDTGVYSYLSDDTSGSDCPSSVTSYSGADALYRVPLRAGETVSATISSSDA
ncbi:MAG: IPT/TIG domain-containing protein, partial [Myxococcota bacterium]